VIGLACTHRAPPTSAWPLPRPGAVLAADDGDLSSVGELAGLLDGRHGADRGELTIDAGDEQDEMAALAGGFDGGVLLLRDADRNGHVREHHHVVEGENWQ